METAAAAVAAAAGRQTNRERRADGCWKAAEPCMCVIRPSGESLRIIRLSLRQPGRRLAAAAAPSRGAGVCLLSNARVRKFCTY